MRIAVLAPPWLPVPPPAYGGTESVIDGLARGLQDAGHDVLLFTTGDSTCPVPRRSLFDEAIGVGGVGQGGIAELRHAVVGYDAVREWGADIVHDHTTVGPMYASHIPAPPMVTTNHGPFEGEMATYYRAISKRVPIIAISRQQASTAVGTAIAAVIHHGIDVDQFEPGPGDGGYALFLGRMCAEKGVRTAILTARAAGMPLKIAAKMREPEEEAYFRAEVLPLLGGDVEFLGEVGGAAKVRLLAHATCLLNPIAWPEPFGMVMIEALACGTPVVATPMGSVPEIIDDGITGFLRPRGPELVAALTEVATIPRTACRASAVERFSIERMVADHLTLYEKVVERRDGLVTIA